MLGRICLTLPMLFAATQDDLPPGWKMVGPKDDSFRIAMPGKVVEKKQQVKITKGFLEVTVLTAGGPKDSAFVVSFCDFAEGDLKKLDKRLDQARDGAVANSGGKLRKEQLMELIDGEDRHPGRDLVIDKNGEVVAQLRIFLVKRRLYQVMVLGAVPARQAGIFLDSFRLNK